jgi:hypothetical protein
LNQQKIDLKKRTIFKQQQLQQAQIQQPLTKLPLFNFGNHTTTAMIIPKQQQDARVIDDHVKLKILPLNNKKRSNTCDTSTRNSNNNIDYKNRSIVTGS